ncbi:glycosyltransferase family 2 protein [Clostridium beijerinckii]|uniref:Glycosyltransferase n=1 Tax=Clostridium beijerinckii TaxID=1520 RepID=A0AAW3W560_CLOBE|nr:glycosyltransferase [Clostridium beijerinckii]MBC2456336.1 glycosyltransferase [Clostridium beijerinckii]MBC2474060.1 glycosyltransferase [Clostridium beijerinckii]NOV62143.1 glycosyltransferase involved in cell wall biosynthesis [Clostridium beijerinckii]NOV68361.1 glycosyltransferase involved in cell wall biosynthesis [Clostridium beijerinckii]NOW30195.1 glycosyltransferase involved in cell wall biosynthesis [Clostridium beijerinckii]
MENTKDLISVIVPVYNVEKYLPQCIDSILNQTEKNLEIILVDDGSLDNSGKICDEFSKRDDRIIVIHKKNNGLSSARNAGLEIARGNYIGFVDSDDWLDKTMYEVLLKLLKENNSDISCCDFFKTANSNDSIPHIDNEIINSYNNIESLNNFYNGLYTQTVVAWNKLYKRELFKDISYPVGKIHEDEGTTYKLYYKANKITYTNRPLYYYRITPNSITTSKFNKKRLDIIDVYDEKVKFIKNINNEEIYSKTLKWYLFKLINCYFECSNNIENNTEYLTLINQKVSETYKSYIQSDKKQLHWIILFSIFKINPKLYKIILRG